MKIYENTLLFGSTWCHLGFKKMKNPTDDNIRAEVHFHSPTNFMIFRVNIYQSNTILAFIKFLNLKKKTLLLNK